MTTTTSFSRDLLLNDPENAFRAGLDGRQSQIWTAMPVIVTSVDFTSMTVACRIAIQGVVSNSDGTETPTTISPCVDVPIVFPSAGGFTLTLPVRVGDEGLGIFSSRCIDSWWQNGAAQDSQPPMESRMHDLSDCFFIPGPKSQPKVISNISSTNAQLRTDDGMTYLEITPSGQINLVANSGLSITGNLSVTGSITATEEVIGNGIALSTHDHSAGALTSPSGPVTGITGPPV